MSGEVVSLGAQNSVYDWISQHAQAPIQNQTLTWLKYKPEFHSAATETNLRNLRGISSNLGSGGGFGIDNAPAPILAAFAAVSHKCSAFCRRAIQERSINEHSILILEAFSQSPSGTKCHDNIIVPGSVGGITPVFPGSMREVTGGQSVSRSDTGAKKEKRMSLSIKGRLEVACEVPSPVFEVPSQKDFAAMNTRKKKRTVEEIFS
ncbi:hypothetical protein C8J57DRAFT_1573363 [Mycena rebaudengoi]|nr:hypothetical protein C8J57DRAFT_1573363 [Mycena rebaudengoi]